MKLILLIVCGLGLLSSVAEESYAQSTKLTVNLRKATIKDVLEHIENNSEFSFMYENNIIDMNTRVDFSASNEPIDVILDQLFNEDMEYRVIGRHIVLFESRNSPVDSGLISDLQQSAISGSVTDQSGQPLPGVTIVVKGTTQGTVTNADGNYMLANVPDDATLVFSFVGMQTQEIDAGNQTSIDVTMQVDAIGIEEVVAIGYGVVKKSDLTGSVSSIKADELERQGPRINFVQALQGAAPGLNITQSGNSASSGSINVGIRGQNSILASNNPLVILDGVPYDGGLNLIDQSTIESIEVLKDASSTAIYGARGANGVILITTKKGKKGKPTISYDGSYGVKQIYRTPNLLTGPEHWEFGVERYGESAISNNYPTRVENYNNGVSTNWVEEATRLGIQNKHTIGISGGADRVEYFVSAGYMDVKGIAKGDDYEHIHGRVNLTLKATDWLEIGTKSQYSFMDNSGLEVDFSGGSVAPYSTSNLGGAFMMNPLIKPYDEDGNIMVYPWPEHARYSNPLSNMNVKDEDFNRRIFTNNYLQIDFPFVDGLSYKLNTGVSYRSASRDIFWGNNSLEGIVNKGQAFSEDSKTNNWLIENLLFYNKEFGDHNVNFTALYSTQKDTYDQARIYSRGFPTEVLTWYQPGSAEYVTPSRTYTQQTYISQMGRLFYSFKEKYLLTLTLRRDGYSAFGSEKKFGIFPSMALGWNMLREEFLINSDLVSQLKLRVSYGENGNQAISPYSTLASVDGNDYLTGQDGNTQGVGYIPSSLENNELGWETTRSYNFGLDFGFLGNRITGAIDLYRSNTKDLLLNRAISVVNGVTSITSNIGEVKNNGIEFMLSSINIARNDFEWSTTFNIAHNKNAIVDLYGDGEDDVSNNWFIGKPIDVNYGYLFDGVWQLDDDIASSAQPNAKPGDVKVKDINDLGEISPADRTFIGQRSPKYTFGLSNSIRFKRFDFSFLISGRQGITRINPLWDTDLVFADAIRNTIKLNWWSEDNPTNDYPANRDGANPFGVRFYKDASYVRLNNVNLSYDFGDYFQQGGTIQNLKVVFSVINGLTFTKWDGLDPEYNNQRAAPLDRVYSLGVNVVF